MPLLPRLAPTTSPTPRWLAAATVLVGLVVGGPAARAGGANDANQLRLELGAGGPGGLIALRYSRVVASTGARLEPALGLAYTGVLGSLVVTQPFATWVVPAPGRGAAGAWVTSLAGYAGYDLSVLRDGARHPWAARTDRIPDGAYQWLDAGLSIQGRRHRLVVTAGIGATFLLAGPDGVGGEAIADEPFWWLYPEGWLGKQRWAPALWSSAGWSF